ncbi:hypothetical protein WR25_14629 [Diploscapter pachys]|uniref:AAA+ ATPase domain-containing protein n=1 Tax=Diploscapter pachys TaxID=2018661 RepID=A0A2A2LET0_9BILA|nr:hypothetical protein WR25_14629 [Diploscapter pachys]
MQSLCRDVVRLHRLQKSLLARSCMCAASPSTSSQFSQISQFSTSPTSCHWLLKRSEEDNIFTKLATLYARKIGRSGERKPRESSGKEDEKSFFEWKLTTNFNGKKREIRIGNSPRKSGEEGKQSKEKGKEEEDPFEIMERIMKQRQKDLEKKYGRRPVSSDDGEQGGDENDQKKKLMRRMAQLIGYSLGLFVLLSIITGGGKHAPGATTIGWSEFMNDILPTGNIQKIDVNVEREKALIYTYRIGDARTMSGKPMASLYEVGLPNPLRFESEVRAMEQKWGLSPDQWTPIHFIRLENIKPWFNIILMTLFIGAIFLLFRSFKATMRKMKMQDITSMFTKSKIRIIDPLSKSARNKDQVIKFKDVAGCQEAKMEIQEFVDYLKNPTKYTKLGARLPRGALMTGPPGCGKTLLAKALAFECTVPFISMNGSEFIEMIGGLGASRIRELFSIARDMSPSVIYIDEIDTIGRKRAAGTENTYSGSDSEQEQTLNQLLTEMDGLVSDHSIVVLASTNRPDVLDKALLRPGRFDRHINIDMPTLIERKEMFDLYLKKIKLEKDMSKTDLAKKLAQLTPGLTGAAINNICNEAAIHAGSRSSEFVSFKDIEYALDRVLAGPEKRTRTIQEEEREIVAYHEAGHALVGWLLPYTDALLKVTIIPRTSAALGFAQYNPKDRKLFTKEELMDRMCMMLGGRVAELIQFGRCTTGAQDDLSKVTKSAYAQVKIYGMNENVGTLSFPQESELQIKPYSKKFGNLIDQEANRLVGRAHKRTEELLMANKDLLEKIAKSLLQREVLHYEDVRDLIGPPNNEQDKGMTDRVERVLPEENE